MSSTVIETALSCASVAAFSIAPPWGALTAAGLVLIDSLLKSSEHTPSNSISIVDINQAVFDEIEKNNIRVAASQINNIYSWVRDYQDSHIPIPANIEAELKANPTGSFATFYNGLHTLLTDPTAQRGLLGIIGDMQATDKSCTVEDCLQGKELPMFACAVGMYLVLFQLMVSIKYIGDKTVDVGEVQATLYMFNGVPERTGWLSYTNNIINQVEQMIQQRLDQITPATPFTHGLFKESLSYFADSGPSVPGFDPSQLGGGDYWPGEVDAINDAPSHTVYALNEPSYIPDMINEGVMIQVKWVRQEYYNLMQQTLYNNFFEPSKMRQIVSRWESGLQKLQEAISQDKSTKPKPSNI